MGWKDGMYWLKGILLSVIIHIIVTFLIVFCLYLYTYIINPPQGTNYAGFGISILLFYLAPLALIIIIPLGGVLGFFYGKYKNKLLIWLPILIYFLIWLVLIRK